MTVERYPNLKEEVGGSIPGCELSSLLDKKNCHVVNCILLSALWFLEILQLTPNNSMFIKNLKLNVKFEWCVVR
jgi:hypothetical protein